MQKRLLPKLENQMERAVLEVLNEILMMESQNRFCGCDKFRVDVAAIALNRLQPRYATSFQGSLFTLEDIQFDQDLQVTIRQCIMKALDMVVSDPRCLEEGCPLMDAHQLEGLELAVQTKGVDYATSNGGAKLS